MVDQPESLPKGPYRLLTVNTAPERAKKVIGEVARTLASQYTIFHVVNVEAIEAVEAAVREHQPNLLFCASMWTPEESGEIIAIGKRLVPGIKTHAIPEGLQVAKGPQGVVDYLVETVPSILEHD